MGDNSYPTTNQGGNPYPAEVKGEALALLFEHGSYRKAERLMSERYPDRSPSRQLISRWANQLEPEKVANLNIEIKQSFANSVLEMGAQAVARLSDALDRLPDEQISIPSGIATDKALRLLEMDRRSSSDLNVTFLIADARPTPRLPVPDTADTIEGELA
jgi:hypothetical protein